MTYSTEIPRMYPDASRKQLEPQVHELCSPAGVDEWVPTMRRQEKKKKKGRILSNRIIFKHEWEYFLNNEGELLFVFLSVMVPR